jgi:hypothetical protein
VQQYAAHIPLLEQQPPVDGKVFATQYVEIEHLLNYAMCVGLQVVTASGDEKKGCSSLSSAKEIPSLRKQAVLGL